MIKSRRMTWTEPVARMEKKMSVYRTFMGKREGNRPLGIPRHRWEDNIKVDLKEIRWGVMDWIHLAQGREQWRVLVNTVMNLRVS
jgi:hypothetical protein